MQYLVRRNFRHNGKFHAQGSKLELAVLDDIMRNNLKAGIIEAVLAKPVAEKTEEEQEEKQEEKTPEKEEKPSKSGKNFFHKKGK